MGIRPGDLVGAIANEAGLRGADIGILQIADSHSIVEVPESELPALVDNLKKSSVAMQRELARKG